MCYLLEFLFLHSSFSYSSWLKKKKKIECNECRKFFFPTKPKSILKPVIGLIDKFLISYDSFILPVKKKNFFFKHLHSMADFFLHVTFFFFYTILSLDNWFYFFFHQWIVCVCVCDFDSITYLFNLFFPFIYFFFYKKKQSTGKAEVKKN